MAANVCTIREWGDAASSQITLTTSYYFHTNLNATATNFDSVNRSLVDAGKTDASISVKSAEVDNNTSGRPDST